MRVILISLLPFLTWPVVHAGQIPVVDGVIGGVPSPTSKFAELLAIPQVANVVTTPGKLRVVENSGICGWCIYTHLCRRRAELCYLCKLETTPDVFQASGYGDLTATESIW